MAFLIGMRYNIPAERLYEFLRVPLPKPVTASLSAMSNLPLPDSPLPEESFILLGNGDRISMREVQNTWFLTNVDLIVLSACETGLGGQFGTGEEIFGFGYLMQNAGARAAMASLWRVSDGGTQVLMNAFYEALQGENITKAEALRQAQIALIIGDYTAIGEGRGSLVVEFIGNNLPKSVQENLSHPYYWAPFILIGNGL